MVFRYFLCHGLNFLNIGDGHPTFSDGNPYNGCIPTSYMERMGV